MKQKFFYLLLVITSISLLSCSDDPINKITIHNLADGDIYLTFQASETLVNSGATVEIQDIDKGEFEYETVYKIPVGATSSAAEGEMAGTFILKAGTKILVIYTSVIDTSGTYTISASVTTSDNLSEDGGILPNPIGP